VGLEQRISTAARPSKATRWRRRKALRRATPSSKPLAAGGVEGGGVLAVVKGTSSRAGGGGRGAAVGGVWGGDGEVLKAGLVAGGVQVRGHERGR
jgi:hypothetical protein